MNIDFYRLQDDAGGRIAFQNALRQAINSRGRNRSADVQGERIDLYAGHEAGSVIEGEIGRVRMDNTPAIASDDCTLEEINLEDGQGIAERTAFLFDSRLSVLALHSRREAVSASRIAGYCDRMARHTIESFSLRPILGADAERKFQSMNVIKRVDVEYTRTAATTLNHSDPSTLGFVRSLRNLNADTLSITVSSGRKKENRLTFEAVTAMINAAFAQKDEAVQKLVISGRNAGDERLCVDLLEDRLRVPISIEFRGRTPSYEQRRRAVRLAYDRHLPTLQ
jgi:hypothetical protein